MDESGCECCGINSAGGRNGEQQGLLSDELAFAQEPK